MAKTNFRSASALNRIHASQIEVKDGYDLKKLLRWMKQSSRKMQASIGTIVFSAMATEAYINYYLTHITSEKTYKRKFNNVSLSDKWLELPKQLKQIEFDKETPEVKLFKQLIKDRRDIFHNTSRLKSMRDRVKYHASLFTKASDAIQAMEGMMRLLDLQDPPLIDLLSGQKIWKRVEK
jgi:hypothetical protein